MPRGFSFLIIGGLAFWIGPLAQAADSAFRFGRSGTPPRITLAIDQCFDSEDETSLGRSIELAQQLATDLRLWKIRLGETTHARMPKLETTSTGACSMDVDDWVPEFVRKHHHDTPEQDGPNCWNTSLVLSELVPELRYTDGDEFAFWLSSPLCHRISRPQEALPGDLIAIRSRRTGNRTPKEVHGLIYLGHGMVFSKNGYRKHSPFALQTELHVNEVYELTRPECRRVGELAPPACETWSEIYRCVPFQTYARDIPLAGNEDLHRSLRELAKIERAISDSAMGKTAPLTEAEIKAVRARINRVVETALRQLSRLTTTQKVERVAWKSIEQRAVSLRMHLDD